MIIQKQQQSTARLNTALPPPAEKRQGLAAVIGISEGRNGEADREEKIYARQKQRRPHQAGVGTSI